MNLRGQPDRPFVLEEFNGTVTWAINLNEVLSYQTWEHDKEAWPLTHDSKKRKYGTILLEKIGRINVISGKHP